MLPFCSSWPRILACPRMFRCMLFMGKAEPWPRACAENSLEEKLLYLPWSLPQQCLFQADFLPLVRREKWWNFNDSFYGWVWMFIVVLTIKMYRGWNPSREIKAISFISLHCVGQWNISIFLTTAICLMSSGAEKFASLRKNWMVIYTGSLTVRCHFLSAAGLGLSDLLSTYAFIVKAVKNNVLLSQNFLAPVSFTFTFSRLDARTWLIYF